MPAIATFKKTANAVVPISPMAPIKKYPETRQPKTAPSVFAAYNFPARFSGIPPNVSEMNLLITGKVPPMSVQGTISIRNETKSLIRLI